MTTTTTRRDEYVAKLKHQLDELNAKMTQIEGQAKAAEQRARDKYEEQVEKLRRESLAASAKLDELKAAGEDSWEKLVAEAERVRDAFKHSFSYFKSQV